MSRILKIVVTGPFGAGKSQFVKTISDIPLVSTERKISRREKGMKTQTTVAMDYGRAEIGDDILHLNGTPGQVRFDFMWDILSREMHGLVMVVDSTAHDTFPDVRAMLDEFLAPKAVPHIVAANKQDLADAVHPEKLRRALNLHPDTPILPCTASHKTSVRFVLSQLAETIQ
ncbi:MAG: ATP/GTP-binding protein [Chloroflexi bacterium]|nr:ATP/GTP-binding protein [Chloroflexota bacterium]